MLSKFVFPLRLLCILFKTITATTAAFGSVFPRVSFQFRPDPFNSELLGIVGARLFTGHPSNSSEGYCNYTVCGENRTPLNKYHYFRCSSIFFYTIFRDCSRHILPLLLKILSSHLSLFRSITTLNIKDDFFNCADKSDYNQLSGLF